MVCVYILETLDRNWMLLIQTGFAAESTWMNLVYTFYQSEKVEKLIMILIKFGSYSWLKNNYYIITKILIRIVFLALLLKLLGYSLLLKRLFVLLIWDINTSVFCFFPFCHFFHLSIIIVHSSTAYYLHLVLCTWRVIQMQGPGPKPWMLVFSLLWGKT